MNFVFGFMIGVIFYPLWTTLWDVAKEWWNDRKKFPPNRNDNFPDDACFP